MPAGLRSAGILLFRRRGAQVEVLLGHPGGPYWTRRDDGAWTLPKGEHPETEEPLAAALREFGEETGFTPAPPFLPLGEVRLKSGKRVTAWASEGDADPAALASNSFEMEWPPRSGRLQAFPEIDRVGWFDLEQARVKLAQAQHPFLDALRRLLAAP